MVHECALKYSTAYRVQLGEGSISSLVARSSTTKESLWLTLDIRNAEEMNILWERYELASTIFPRILVETVTCIMNNMEYKNKDFSIGGY